MKRTINRLFLLLILMAVLLSAFTVTGFAEENPETNDSQPEELTCYDPGDVNEDGVVNSRDAIYTLYCITLGDISPEEYSPNQSIDFNRDSEESTADAIHLLYAAMGFSQYNLGDTVHNYYNPSWSWSSSESGMTAKVSIQCSCGQQRIEEDCQVECVHTAATCTVAGSEEYTATAELNGKTYTNSYTVVLEPTKHDMVAVEEGSVCTAYSYCQKCDYETAPKGHSLVVNLTEATCQDQAIQTTTCENCDYEESSTLEGLAPHKFVFDHAEDVQDSDKVCKFTKKSTYKCSICGEETVDEQETYYNHTYTVTLTQEPTCVNPGEKTYSCSNCDHSYTESVGTNDNAHSWDAGVPTEDGTTYTCASCGETKTTIAMTESGLATDSLSQTEIALDDGTSISLDEETVDDLDKERNVVISVTEADKSSLKLSEEQKEQIGKSTVYDFSMVYADNQQSVSYFGGQVTISLPYTLEEGDDIDSIDVWFIADDGTLTTMEGTYAGGFVTFTTDHFSYYTVTRLTPAERCARYGHMDVSIQKTPTCTTDGYTATVCQRCGRKTNEEVIPATGHNYQETVTGLSCTTPGLLTKTCTCGHSIASTIPATGHNMVEDASQYVAPTCEKPGQKVTYCTNDGCDHTVVEELAQLPHQYVDDIKKADCTSNGHHKKRCEICGAEQFIDEAAPTGHHYTNENAIWNWSDDYTSATVTLVCAYNLDAEDHTKELKAVVTRKNTNITSCEEGRTIVVSAQASFNKYTYTSDEVSIQLDPGTHQIDESWHNNANQHFHKCTLCKIEIDPAEHSWSEANVTKAATCGEDGTAVYTCLVCSYKRTETIPATGVHTYEDGVCVVCGASEIVCNHVRTYEKTIDLSAYDICGTPSLKIKACECGKQSMPEWQFDCPFETTFDTVIDEYGFEKQIQTKTCPKCGLVDEIYDGNEYDPKTCTATYYQASKITFDGTTIMEAKWLATEDMMIQQHPVMLTGKVVDLREKGFCSEVLNEYACPCGEEIRYEVDYSIGGCNWNWISTENIATDGDTVTEAYITFECSNCGAEKHCTSRYQLIDCYDTNFDTVAYYINGEKVFEYDTSFRMPVHDYLIVDYESYGDSCEDGIYLWYECKNCDKAYEAYLDYHVGVNVTEIDLSSSNICINTLRQTSCACELVKSTYTVGNASCSFEFQSQDDATGRSTYVCNKCNAVRILTVAQSEKDESCKYIYSEEYEYYDKDGNHLATTYNAYENESHDYSKITYELLGKSCKDGVKVINTCVDCGNSNSYKEYTHNPYKTNVLDFSKYDGICSGTVTQYECPCGEEYYSYHNYSGNFVLKNSWDEPHKDGVVHHYERYECSVCDVYYEMDSYLDAQESPCRSVYIGEFSFFLSDGTYLGTFRDRTTSEAHDYRSTYTLLPGSVTCENGLEVTNTCTKCGYIENYNTWGGHQLNTMETIDLSEYGSICGGTMKHLKCPCGAQERFDFSDDVLCDLEQVSVPVWIEGAINDTQYTTNGLQGTYSNAYTFTCAVTDPVTCGLKIRMAEYWLLEENCTAVEYQTWQLGYDELSNTWEYEVTVPTGERHAYHPYTFSDSTSTQDDGTTLSCVTYSCPDCGSYYTEKNWYQNDTQVKFERNCVNTLNNGENKQYTLTNNRDLVYANYRYLTLELHEYIHADGTTYWTRCDHNYDFSGRCQDTRVQTSSDGYYYTDTVDACVYYYTSEDTPSTCTQFGIRFNGNVCDVCDYADSDVTTLEPKAHNWVWNDEIQMYVCSYCALENSNGASGQIVMEDLSDYYSTGIDYVVGYWNRGGLEFYPFASVILNDVTGDDNQLDLNFADFVEREEVVAISCNKEAIHAAAEAAVKEAGYSGSYSIRITFLPTSPVEELDYAITFDPVGSDNNTCTHNQTYETAIDLKTLGGCEGTIYVESCECGYQSQAWWDVSCNLIPEEEPRYVTDQYGFVHLVNVTHCDDCGLTIETVEDATEYDPNTCTGWNLITTKIMLGNSVLADTQWHDQISQWLSGRVHPTRPTGNTVDLRNYGLCSEVLYEYSCPCEEAVKAYYTDDFNLRCNWRYDEESSTETMDVFVCGNCGAIKQQQLENSRDSENCLDTAVYTITYLVNGQQVFSYSYSTYAINHSYEVENYELHGTSCEDGIYLWYRCTDCGKTKESYSTSHVYTNSETIELTGVCSDYAIQMSCPCEENLQLFILRSSETVCDFTWGGYDYETGMYLYNCSVCGAVKRELQSTEVNPDNCAGYSIYQETIYDKNGNKLAAGISRHKGVLHANNVEFELLGDFCTDGVFISEHCERCGHTDSYTTNEHVVFQGGQYDMSAFDLCGNTIYLNLCVCGMEVNLPGLDNCSWQMVDYKENIRKYYCPNCQTYRTESLEFKDSIGTCYAGYTITHTFEKEGVEPFSFSFDTFESFHAEVCQITPLGDTCQEGAAVISTCQICDYMEEFNYFADNHCSMIVARTMLTNHLPKEDKLCGELDIITIGCACGEISEQLNKWRGLNSCDFNNDLAYYDEELGVHVQVCSKCGVERYNTEGQGSDVEGNPCQQQFTGTTHFRRNGKELFSYEGTDYSWNHQQICTFTMNGDTCDEGYTVYTSCKRCGEIFDEQEGYGCDNQYCIDFQELYIEGACNRITLRTLSCPCGKNQSHDISYKCDWEKIGQDDETGESVYQCNKCGLVKKEAGSNQHRVPGTTCTYACDVYSTYFMNDAAVGELNYTKIWKNHVETCSYEPFGDSCDEGYRVHATCVLCNATWTEEEHFYGCEEMHRSDAQVIFHDDICGPIVLDSWSCYCTANQKQGFSYYGCQFEGIGWDEETASEIYQCSSCGLIRYTKMGDTEWIDECHYQYPISNTYYMGDECLGTLSYNRKEESHSYRYSFRLEGSTCEDGYYVDGYCVSCGDTFIGNELNYAHDSHDIEIYDLGNDYGMCHNNYLYHRGCACGMITNWEWDVYCDGQSTGIIDSKTGYYQNYCADCDSYFSFGNTGTLDTENCLFYGDFYFRLLQNGEEKLFLAEPITWLSHDYLVTNVTLNNPETCDDGVILDFECAYCGSTMTEEHWEHFTYKVKDVDFEEHFGACYGFVQELHCACGQNNRYNWNYRSCSWISVPSESYTDMIDGVEHFYSVSVCQNCGLTQSIDRHTEKEESSCTVYIYEDITFSKGDAEPVSITQVGQTEQHSRVFTGMEAVDGNCENGYTADWECLACGATGTREGYSHEPLCTEIFDFSTLGLCPGTASSFRCACGQQTNYGHSNSCDWELIAVEPNNGDSTNRYYDKFQCTKCGLVRECLDWDEVIEGTCLSIRHETYTYSHEGETIMTISREIHNEMHNIYTTPCTLTLMGSNCDEGFLVEGSCADCGEMITVTGWGCDDVYITAQETFQHDDICGTIYLNTLGCACTPNQSQGFSYSCAFEETGETDENGATISKCVNCPLYRHTLVSEPAKVDGDDCLFSQTISNTYYLDGVEQKAFRYERLFNHNYEETYALAEGCTCFDGVDVFNTCTNCDYSEYVETRTGHQVEFVQQELPSDSCGGYLEFVSCRACNTTLGIRSMASCTMEFLDLWEETDENGNIVMYMKEVCANGCGFGIVSSTYYEEPDQCSLIQYTIDEYIISRENITETIGYCSSSYEMPNHNYVYTYELVEGAVTCEDGLNCFRSCSKCGESEMTGTIYNHQQIIANTYDLSVGCGTGSVSTYTCPCRSSGISWVPSESLGCHAFTENSWSQEDSAGDTHYYTERTCDCGLTVLADSCGFSLVYTYTYDGEVILTFSSPDNE